MATEEHVAFCCATFVKRVGLVREELCPDIGARSRANKYIVFFFSNIQEVHQSNDLSAEIHFKNKRNPPISNSILQRGATLLTP